MPLHMWGQMTTAVWVLSSVSLGWLSPQHLGVLLSLAILSLQCRDDGQVALPQTFVWSLGIRTPRTHRFHFYLLNHLSSP